jgi:hypothetical protein
VSCGSNVPTFRGIQQQDSLKRPYASIRVLTSHPRRDQSSEDETFGVPKRRWKDRIKMRLPLEPNHELGSHITELVMLVTVFVATRSV